MTKAHIQQIIEDSLMPRGQEEWYDVAAQRIADRINNFMHCVWPECKGRHIANGHYKTCPIERHYTTYPQTRPK